MYNEHKTIINNINKLVKYILKSNLNIVNNNLEKMYNTILISKLYKNILLYTVYIFLIKSIIL